LRATQRGTQQPTQDNVGPIFRWFVHSLTTPGHLNLLNRLKNSSPPVDKALAFTKYWEYFTNPGSPQFESLIRHGRYAGTTAAETTGKLLRSRYNHLIHTDRTTKFWSASSPRDVETAEHFAIGFFGLGWNNSHMAHLEIIPENPNRGANTLTPGKSCLKYQDDYYSGRRMGYLALDTWQRTFTESIKTRLAPSAPDFNFTAVDIYSMFEMCGFEFMVRGVSSWCNVFTNNDWRDFEYGRDLLHFYRAGQGNKYAGAMGLLWLDAALKNMLNESDAAKNVYASFVHDGDIIPLIATLGLLDELPDPLTGRNNYLPMQSRKWDRNWKTSDIVPMGGRVVFERIKCDQALHPVEYRTFVRLLINDGHIAMSVRTGGLLEHDLTLKSLESIVKLKRETFGDFREVCEIDLEGPAGIDFLHQ
jgi:acid phosphatase